MAIEDLAAALVVLFPELGPVKAEITEFREEVGIIDALCGDANQALSWD